MILLIAFVLMLAFVYFITYLERSATDEFMVCCK